MNCFFFLQFRQYRHKDISEISPDKKNIAYRGVQKFFFDQEASAPLTENDDLVVLNVQLNVSLNLNLWHVSSKTRKLLSSVRTFFLFVYFQIVEYFFHFHQIGCCARDKCVLQIAEYGFHWLLDNLGTRLNNTLEEIPIVSTIKHMMPSTSERQKKRKTGKVWREIRSIVCVFLLFFCTHVMVAIWIL